MFSVDDRLQNRACSCGDEMLMNQFCAGYFFFAQLRLSGPLFSFFCIYYSLFEPRFFFPTCLLPWICHVFVELRALLALLVVRESAAQIRRTTWCENMEWGWREGSKCYHCFFLLLPSRWTNRRLDVLLPLPLICLNRGETGCNGKKDQDDPGYGWEI